MSRARLWIPCITPLGLSSRQGQGRCVDLFAFGFLTGMYGRQPDLLLALLTSIAASPSQRQGERSTVANTVDSASRMFPLSHTQRLMKCYRLPSLMNLAWGAEMTKAERLLSLGVDFRDYRGVTYTLRRDSRVVDLGALQSFRPSRTPSGLFTRFRKPMHTYANSSHDPQNVSAKRLFLPPSFEHASNPPFHL